MVSMVSNEEIMKQLLALEKALSSRADVPGFLKEWIHIIILVVIVAQTLLVVYITRKPSAVPVTDKGGINADDLRRELESLKGTLLSSSGSGSLRSSPPPSPEQQAVTARLTRSTANAAAVLSPRASAG